MKKGFVIFVPSRYYLPNKKTVAIYFALLSVHQNQNVIYWFIKKKKYCEKKLSCKHLGQVIGALCVDSTFKNKNYQLANFEAISRWTVCRWVT